MRTDVEITYLRAGGPGGQHRNKRYTGVRLRHTPTGIVVTATERKERRSNLSLAYRRLDQRLEERRRERERKPRRKTRPTRASVERRLKEKTRRARTKQQRQRPRREED